MKRFHNRDMHGAPKGERCVMNRTIKLSGAVARRSRV